jgi:hypothetical protein
MDRRMATAKRRTMISLAVIVTYSIIFIAGWIAVWLFEDD